MRTVERGSFLVLMSTASVGFTLFACGGATPEPESAPADSDHQEPLPSTESDTEESPVDESSESTGDASVTVSTEDFQEAMQIVLDDDALKAGLELEEPGRFPLKIAGSDIPSGVMVTCVGEKAEVIEVPADPKGTPVLDFMSIEFSGTMGVFKYRHDAAGIRGTTKVKKTDGRWELMSSRVNDYGGVTE